MHIFVVTTILVVLGILLRKHIAKLSIQQVYVIKKSKSYIQIFLTT